MSLYYARQIEERLQQSDFDLIFSSSTSPIAHLKTDLPIVFWDERLSTVAAERTLLEADASRKRRSEVIDKMAAAYILQGALDRLSNIG